MKNNLFIKESFLNATEGYRSGDTEVYETAYDSIKELYKFLTKEYGRCISKMFVDDKNGDAIQRGWVFQKRIKYYDSKETFLSETWVTVHNSEPIETIKYDYHSFA